MARQFIAFYSKKKNFYYDLFWPQIIVTKHFEILEQTAEKIHLTVKAFTHFVFYEYDNSVMFLNDFSVSWLISLLQTAWSGWGNLQNFLRIVSRNMAQ